MNKLNKKAFALALAAFASLGLLTTEAFAAKWQGEIPAYQEHTLKVVEGGPKLLFSDSPEMVQHNGIMYQDLAEGKVRLFFHHVNDTAFQQKLAVIVNNRSVHPAEITLVRRGISKANTDWLEAGKEAQIKYFAKQKPESFTVRYNRPFELLSQKEGQRFEPQELITGIVDFEFSKPMEVSFVMLPVHTKLTTALRTLEPLPADVGGHVLRGTFPFADRYLELEQAYNPSKAEIWGVTLADHDVDKYVTGVDALTGNKVVNYGNYGVVYQLRFETEGHGKTALRFNPWGGIYAGAALLDLDERSSKLIKLPKHRLYMGDTGSEETMLLDVIKGNHDAQLTFSPPGSSNLPVRFFWSAADERGAKKDKVAKKLD